MRGQKARSGLQGISGGIRIQCQTHMDGFGTAFLSLKNRWGNFMCRVIPTGYMEAKEEAKAIANHPTPHVSTELSPLWDAINSTQHYAIEYRRCNS
jgi:hypothetical protein